MHRLFFHLLVFLLTALSVVAGELFPFVLTYDAPDNVTNMAAKLDAPAGRDGFVRVRDGHFATDKARIRFWGTNTCFAANFPTREQADRMADRLARFGINCVRLHHMDSRDLWGPSGSRPASQMVLDPDRLDRLDYYIAALKKRGVYVNLNLHVSRTLDERDGFPKKENRPKYDKGIDNFYKPLIDANKKFAADLLNHVNPYTGTAYKDEPAVAMIEINNENSIVVGWTNRREIEAIGEPFLGAFQKEWNDWLRAKYTNDAALRKAWRHHDTPLGRELLRRGDFTQGLPPSTKEGWYFQKDRQTDASLEMRDGALRIDVRKKGKESWAPQLYGTGFAVEKGKPYTFTIELRANRKTTPRFLLRSNSAPWGGLGFEATLPVDTEWRTLGFTGIPTADDKDARINFGSFTEGDVYEVRRISVKPGGKVGLPETATLAEGTIPVLWRSKLSGCTAEQIDDFLLFLLDLERRYWSDMYRFLKEDIKVGQVVSGTQLEYGGTRNQAELDYCDIHAYWNHPTFPRVPWDRKDWYLRNRALVNAMSSGGTLLRLGPKRVAGLPYTVSEYNHPYPNFYAAEGLPMLAAYGAFQDWDGIFPFAYSHSERIEPTHISSFFDTCGNTVQMAHMIACHRLFCGETIRPAAETLVAPLTAEKEREIFLRIRDPRNFDLKALGIDNRYALTHRVALDTTGKVKDIPRVPEIPADQQVFIGRGPGNREQLIYNQENPERGYFIANAPGALLFTGFVEEGKTYASGEGLSRIDLTFGRTNLGWATVSMTEVERSATKARVLLVATGEMKNTDMTIQQLDGDKITVLDQWGKAPVCCEGIPLTVRNASMAKRPPKCWALDPAGNRMKEIPPGTEGTLELKPEYRTIWYELEVDLPK